MDRNDKACEPKTVKEYLDHKEDEIRLEAYFRENPVIVMHPNCRCEFVELKMGLFQRFLRVIKKVKNRIKAN